MKHKELCEIYARNTYAEELNHAELQLVEDASTALRQKYKHLFGEHDYVGVGPGWWPLLERMFIGVNTLLETELQGCTVTFVQIKEKFGGLRAYYQIDAPATYTLEAQVNLQKLVDKYIDAAEVEADKTCEVCGEPGHSRPTSWIKTLCDTHYALREKRDARRLNRNAS